MTIQHGAAVVHTHYVAHAPGARRHRSDVNVTTLGQDGTNVHLAANRVSGKHSRVEKFPTSFRESEEPNHTVCCTCASFKEGAVDNPHRAKGVHSHAGATHRNLQLFFMDFIVEEVFRGQFKRNGADLCRNVRADAGLVERGDVTSQRNRGYCVHQSRRHGGHTRLNLV